MNHPILCGKFVLVAEMLGSGPRVDSSSGSKSGDGWIRWKQSVCGSLGDARM